MAFFPFNFGCFFVFLFYCRELWLLSDSHTLLLFGYIFFFVSFFVALLQHCKLILNAHY